MPGPCLCGDPYCPSCGNPEQENFKDAIDDLCEKMEDEQLSDHELGLFISVGFAAVKEHRRAVGGIMSDVNADHNAHVDHLQNQIDLLKGGSGK